MRKILVLNCGSSSVKYELVNMQNSRILARGLVEKIGMEDAVINHHYLVGEDYYDVKLVREVPTHKSSIKMIIDILVCEEYGVIEDINNIYGIGHRAVHGGEKYTGSAYVTDEVKSDIKKCIELAPLHNPHNLAGIEACEVLVPDHHQVVVFDTAFHQTMPEKAYMYGLPYELYSKYGIRKYGFHGTSHQYVSERASIILGKALNELKIVSCHLGNGSSLCAINSGKSVDTSMGFTPLPGMIMGTRTGDLDPYILLYLMNKESLSVSEINTLINRHSGLYGISGVSRDFREIIEEVAKDNKRAKLALDMFVYRVKHYIGAYVAQMNGCDVLIFTAGIGENSHQLRRLVCEDMDFMGISIDEEKNIECTSCEGIISTSDSKLKILCIPTNEELMIASETVKIIKEHDGK